MQCWQCGADVRPGERTCGYCGARLTSPPGGRPQRPPTQQRRPSPRQPARRPYEDDWEAEGDSGYEPGYDGGDESAYGSALPPDDRGYGRPQGRSQERRGGGRRGPSRPSRPGGDEGGWEDGEDERPNRRGQSRGRSRGGQEPRGADDYGRYEQPDYGQSDAYGDGYPGGEYAAPEPDPRDDPLNDPRAPRNLRSTPRRGPDSRGGRPQGGPSRYPNGDPGQGYGDRGYGQGGAQDPYGSHGSHGSYDEPGRARRSQPSSADNRYGRQAGARGQAAPYDDGYGDQGYGGYEDSYGGGRPSPRQQNQGYDQGYDRYERSAPQDQQSWYHQVGARARDLQQRWGETMNSIRIPGVRHEEGAEGKRSSSRRVVTTVVLVLVVLAALGAGGVFLAPKVLNRLHPTTATTSSPLCVAKGAAKTGTPPTPDSHFKQFVSSRSFYGVNYPETWTVEPTQKTANGYDYIDNYTLPNSTSAVSIEQAEAACALTDSAIIQGEVAAAQQQNITFKEDTSAAQTQTIGGETWQRREYDVSVKGVTLHMVILACHHQGRAYIIVLASKTTSFKQDDSGIFEPMLKSFTFTK